MNGFIRVSILISFLLIAMSCGKDDDDSSSSNSANGKSTAVFNSHVTYGKMTDQDSNIYKTVSIGGQTWMAENLRTTKYNDGSAIPNVNEDGSWVTLSTGAYCNYNKTTNKDSIATFGRLYNWYAVNTGKLAPKGWRVPTNAEWLQLLNHLGGEGSSDKLREKGATHWDNSNTSATNETGFTALPAGIRDIGGTFSEIGSRGSWWSASELNAFAFYRYMDTEPSSGAGASKELGHSVRCLRDSTTVYTTTAAFVATTTSGTMPHTVGFTDQSTNNPTSWSWDFGDGGTSSQQNPSYTYSTAGCYTVNLEVINQYGSNTETKTNYISVKVIGDGETGTFTDTRDNRIYKTVKIGNQIWMAENLKYLPAVVGTGTSSQSTPYYYVFDYNGTDINEAMATSNYATYGVLYNWSAAMNGASSSSANPSGVQGVCPAGWHLPSEAEWEQLTDYLAGEAVAGRKLKETGTTHWNSPNPGVTNETGFTALPGGYSSYGGSFVAFGTSGYFWTATESTTNNANCKTMSSVYDGVGSLRGTKEYGLSVRCVKD